MQIFLQRSLNQILLFLPGVYLEISIIVLKKGQFPCVVKHADVVTVHKKKEKNKNNKLYPPQYFKSL